MIRARRISKSFGRKQVLHGIDFEVGSGELVAMMGANGAGKSTLFDILSSVDPDFEGEASLSGHDIRKDRATVRSLLGYVPGRFSLYPDLTVAENLDFFARAYGARPEQIESLAPHLWPSLAPFSSLRAGHLSGGMKQKLAVCCSLVHDPSVLLLDEPTIGVDPASRRDVWKELDAFRDKGGTVLISTHYIDEASMADRVLFLHGGRKLLFGTPEELTSSFGGRLWEVSCLESELPATRASLAMRPEVLDCYLWGGTLHVVTDASALSPIPGCSLREIRPSLEDLFIRTIASETAPKP